MRKALITHLNYVSLIHNNMSIYHRMRRINPDIFSSTNTAKHVTRSLISYDFKNES